MKKIFTLFSAAFMLAGLNAQTTQTLEQFSNGHIQNDSTPLCQSDIVGEGTVNHNSRLYDIADFGITSNFTPTRVDFAGGFNAPNGMTVWVELAKVNGDYTSENNIEVDYEVGGSMNSNSQSPQDNWYTIDVENAQTYLPGEKFAVAVVYEFVNGGNRLWLGNNDTAQNPETSPSYIGFPGSECVSNDPTPVADLGFPVSWLISVTGEVEGLGLVDLSGRALSVYPNPATDVINVELGANKSVQSIEIVNLAGQSVQNAKSAGSLNISSLAPGVYVLRVKDNDNVTHMSRIVKK